MLWRKITSLTKSVHHNPQLGRLELTELEQKEKQKNPSGWGAGGRRTKEGRVVEREGGTMAATQMARFKSREYLDLVKSIGECKSKIEEDAIMKNEVGSAARPPEFRHRYFFYPVIPLFSCCLL